MRRTLSQRYGVLCRQIFNLLQRRHLLAEKLAAEECPFQVGDVFNYPQKSGRIIAVHKVNPPGHYRVVEIYAVGEGKESFSSPTWGIKTRIVLQNGRDSKREYHFWPNRRNR